MQQLVRIIKKFAGGVLLNVICGDAANHLFLGYKSTGEWWSCTLIAFITDDDKEPPQCT